MHRVPEGVLSKELLIFLGALGGRRSRREGQPAALPKGHD